MPIYENKADHRPPNWSKDKKSKWIVEVTEEEEIFFHGYEQNWLHEESESIWAIKVEDESPANSNMRCDSLKSLMIINKLSKFL
ncbi:hypothetical protein HADU_08936 [Acinetobacter sp. HA]|nr:hypothetical protein HADU_08936 [Acinetobacter sp. HA]